VNKNEYRKMYDVEGSHWWYVALHDLILHFLKREQNNKDYLNILDAGCGTGRLCQLMSRCGNVSGCDISEYALKFCSERKIHFFYADLNIVDLGNGRYDVITSIDVLYHKAIKDDSVVLKKFFDALKPGGVLMLNLPAYNFLKSAHDIAVHTERRYTKSGLLHTLNTLGFIIENASYRVCFLFPFIVCYRLILRPFLNRRYGNEVTSDVKMPPGVINKLLLWINKIENYFIESFSIPFGTSVFVVARKPLV